MPYIIVIPVLILIWPSDLDSVRTDLHIHSTASDGRWTPEQVVTEVRARGIGLFAIADHDSAAGVLPAQTLAQMARNWS